jgi:LDH2 family malate/lactate/ureidoglycolate dehydrogenase
MAMPLLSRSWLRLYLAALSLKRCWARKNGKPVPSRLGHFFIAVDISAFIDLEEFKKTTGEILGPCAVKKKVPERKDLYRR